MVNRKILIISKTISFVYLLSFITLLLYFVLDNQSQKNIFVLLFSYWFIPYPWIAFSLISDSRRRKETVFGFLTLSLLLPIIGNFIYLLMGIITYTKKDQIEFTKKIEAMMRVNEVSNLKTLKGSTKVSYNECYCYLDAAKWINSIIDAIMSAEHEICISFFYILQGRNKNALLRLLTLKLKQGVKVYIAIDASSRLFGAQNKDLLDLKKIGATIEIIKKFSRFPFSFNHNLRSHYKIVIIDGYKCFTGGANIGDLYIHQKRRMGYWNDNYFYISGSGVANALKSIIAINGKLLGDFNYTHKLKKKEPRTLEIVENQPEFFYIKHEEAIKKIMRLCKKRFYIYVPYLASPEWLLNDLIKLSRRGVDVKIIIPHFADKKSVYLITKYNAKYLSKKGVKVLLLKHTYVHSKTIISDNSVFSGTSNFDNRSFYLNYELMFYITDGESVKGFVQKWFYDELFCVEWNSEKHSLSKWERIALPTMMLFRGVL